MTTSKKTAKKPAKALPDWERIEARYRTGLLSLREIARLDGAISEAMIRKKAKQQCWVRDLDAKIQLESDALVIKESGLQRATEEETIQAGALAITQVKMRHRGDLTNLRNTAVDMLRELQAAADPDLPNKIMSALGAQQMDPQARAVLQVRIEEFLRLHNRAGSLQKLADTITKVMQFERAVYNMGKDGEESAESRSLSDVERASRLASLVAVLRARKDMQPAGEDEGEQGE